MRGMTQEVGSPNNLVSLLAQIEAELKQLQLWQQEPPNAQALASRLPFCIDTLCFTEWLQWVYIPRLTVLIECSAPLPHKSGIVPYAEQVLGASLENGPNYRRLLQLIAYCDKGIFP